MPHSSSNKTGEREKQRENEGKMSSTADVFANIQCRKRSIERRSERILFKFVN